MPGKQFPHHLYHTLYVGMNFHRSAWDTHRQILIYFACLIPTGFWRQNGLNTHISVTSESNPKSALKDLGAVIWLASEKFFASILRHFTSSLLMVLPTNLTLKCIASASHTNSEQYKTTIRWYFYLHYFSKSTFFHCRIF